MDKTTYNITFDPDKAHDKAYWVSWCEDKDGAWLSDLHQDEVRAIWKGAVLPFAHERHMAIREVLANSSGDNDLYCKYEHLTDHEKRLVDNVCVDCLAKEGIDLEGYVDNYTEDEIRAILDVHDPKVILCYSLGDHKYDIATPRNSYYIELDKHFILNGLSDEGIRWDKIRSHLVGRFRDAAGIKRSVDIKITDEYEDLRCPPAHGRGMPWPGR